MNFNFLEIFSFKYGIIFFILFFWAVLILSSLPNYKKKYSWLLVNSIYLTFIIFWLYFPFPKYTTTLSFSSIFSKINFNFLSSFKQEFLAAKYFLTTQNMKEPYIRFLLVNVGNLFLFIPFYNIIYSGFSFSRKVSFAIFSACVIFLRFLQLLLTTRYGSYYHSFSILYLVENLLGALLFILLSFYIDSFFKKK